jgi:hypothetical protein
MGYLTMSLSGGQPGMVVVGLLRCELQRQAPNLVAPKTLETAMLLNAIALMLKAASDGFAQATCIQDTDR